MQTVVSAIVSRRAKPVVDCIVDKTLPDSVHGQRVFLASNLHNNEELLPHYFLQLLSLIVSLPVGSSYVSIYESGSTDQTGEACALQVQSEGSNHAYAIVLAPASRLPLVLSHDADSVICSVQRNGWIFCSICCRSWRYQARL